MYVNVVPYDLLLWSIIMGRMALFTRQIGPKRIPYPKGELANIRPNPYDPVNIPTPGASRMALHFGVTLR